MARRILLLITDLEIGGTPTVVRDLAVRLNDPPRVVVDVACLKGHGPVADDLVQAGIDVHPLGASRAIQFPAVVARLVSVIRRQRIDIVFSFLVHANVVAAAAAVLCREVLFVQSVQTTQPYPAWHWQVQRLVHHAAEAVVVPSASVANAAREWAGVPPEKIRLIPNAVDADRFERPPHLPPPSLARIAYVGRLDPVKRIPDLLEAMALLPGVSLDIFGEGPQRPHLLDAVTRLGLAGRVITHGVVRPPERVMHQISLLVLPSQAEGFPLVLIEAMAAGVPIVATDVPGCRDAVRHEVTGLLVPVASPALLAEAIRRLRNDDALRQRLVEAGKAEVRSRYSWAAILPQYRQVLRLGDAVA